ncbi:carbohydrate ABC transporter permease [Paenibacillus sp.]|uniref:carbohydrate ABC transporter permease n=1 Tax=Paenibacillus sp. TaxID=58172 RepID=UPI002D4E399B|nr:carbohydrate ABC transporter permease [Paenibacillus sp.]HZG57805.1 carbohydrate ABC transporter permease [Paenibacillus sp.]
MRQSLDKRLFAVTGYIILILISLCCVLPFLLIFVGSLTKESEVVRNGYRLFPGEWSFAAYELVFKAPWEIVRAVSVSVSLVVVGTAIGVFITAMTAYVLQRKDVRYRNIAAFYIYLTSVFSGGLVPYYIIMVDYLHMKDMYLALLLPLLLNVFNILVMKSFYASIPEAIVESGKMDGAGELKIFIALVLPIAKPGLATVGLFIALAYWNDWFNAMLFISDERLYPLQFYLYNILNQANALANMSAVSGIPSVELPKETVKLAMTVLAVAPIMLVYPLAQRYIVGGITIGAVKG